MTCARLCGKPLTVSIRVPVLVEQPIDAVIHQPRNPSAAIPQVRHPNTQETLLVRVDVRADSNGVLLISFSNQPAQFSPYRYECVSGSPGVYSARSQLFEPCAVGRCTQLAGSQGHRTS
jgi:hypothetical protein